MHCTVEIETAIGPSCPLVEMAREQGGGVVMRSEAGVFENAYVRRDGILDDRAVDVSSSVDVLQGRSYG